MGGPRVCTHYYFTKTRTGDPPKASQLPRKSLALDKPLCLCHTQQSVQTLIITVSVGATLDT